MHLRSSWRIEARLPADPELREAATWAPLTDEEGVTDEAEARARLAQARAEPGAKALRLMRIEEYVDLDA